MVGYGEVMVGSEGARAELSQGCGYGQQSDFITNNQELCGS